MPADLIDDLIQLSHFLGEPLHGLAILAEGNASSHADEQTFWVKASGFGLQSLTKEGLVRVRFDRIKTALGAESLTDEEVKLALAEARADEAIRMPSVETFMHAYLLSLPDVRFVGHCHPTALLPILCLAEAQEIAKQRLFPDEVVCCGPRAAFVPYMDPGLPLAHAIRASVEEYIAEEGYVPKTIWLQNHGLIALGASPKEVESATLMSAKAAQVWVGALSTGRALHPMTPEQITRIHSRPDEHYRQKLLWEVRGGA